MGSESERTLIEQGIPVERLEVAEASSSTRAFAVTISRSCCSSRRAESYVRSGRCWRSLAQAVAHGARIVRGRSAAGWGSGCPRRLHTPRGRCGRLGLRPVAREAFPRPRSIAQGHAAGTFVLRRRARLAHTRTCRVGVTTTSRDTGPPTSTRSASRRRSTTRAARSTPTPTYQERPTEPDVRAYLHDRFPALEHATASREPARAATRSPPILTSLRHRTPSTRTSGWWGRVRPRLKHGPPIAERLAAAFMSGARMPANFSLGERSPSRSLRTASSGMET